MSHRRTSIVNAVFHRRYPTVHAVIGNIRLQPGSFEATSRAGDRRTTPLGGISTRFMGLHLTLTLQHNCFPLFQSKSMLKFISPSDHSTTCETLFPASLQPYMFSLSTLRIRQFYPTSEILLRIPYPLPYKSRSPSTIQLNPPLASFTPPGVDHSALLA